MKLPSIVKRIDASHLKAVDTEELIPEMLRTIKIPQNLKQLGDRLPKANYEPLKLTLMDKNNFLASLDRKENGKYSQSVSYLKKASGHKRRASPPGYLKTGHPEYMSYDSNSKPESSIIGESPHPDKGSETEMPENKPKSIRLGSKENEPADHSIRNLNRKKAGLKLQGAILAEDYLKKNVQHPEAFSRKYNSMMHNIRM